MNRRKASLLKTAYHEAGHAVTAWYHGRGVKRVSIVPEEYYLGKVEHFRSRIRPDLNVNSTIRITLQNWIVISLAGVCAEAKQAGRHDWRGASYDLDGALDMCGNICMSDKESEAYLNYLMVRVRNLLDIPDIWRRVELTASALMEKKVLSKAEFLELMGPNN